MKKNLALINFLNLSGNVSNDSVVSVKTARDDKILDNVLNTPVLGYHEVTILPTVELIRTRVTVILVIIRYMKLIDLKMLVFVVGYSETNNTNVLKLLKQFLGLLNDVSQQTIFPEAHDTPLDEIGGNFHEPQQIEMPFYNNVPLLKFLEQNF